MHRRSIRRKNRARFQACAREVIDDHDTAEAAFSPICPIRLKLADTTRCSRRAVFLPSCLQILAESEDGEIMALRHRESPRLRRAISSGIGSYARGQENSRGFLAPATQEAMHYT